MRAKTLQIVWHCKEPVLTVDFLPNNPALFATGGADKDIKIWEVTSDSDGSPAVNYVCSLGGLTSSVNIVRFSPLGDMLVCGGDKGEMMLWKPVDPAAPKAASGQEGDERPPLWRAAASLRAHTDDVSDAAWSPDGSALATASVENDVVLWDMDVRRAAARLHGHQHYVQGVCWDPLGRSIITLSNDRTAKVFTSKPVTSKKHQSAAAVTSSSAMIKTFALSTTLSRRSIPDNNDAAGKPVPGGLPSSSTPGAAAPHPGSAPSSTTPVAPPAMPAPPARHPLFQDENLNTFFRRPAWAPDGSFVVLPAGVYKQDVNSCASPAAYIFARGDWSAPVAQLPTLGRPPLVVRFSPVLYTLRAGEQASSQPHKLWDALPYRMVWAVGTVDSVLVYETQRLEPVLLLGGLHMAPITDLAWSSDGNTLMITSMDGYCSVAMFDAGELGEPMQLAGLPPQVAACVSRDAAVKHAERQAKLAAASQAAKSVAEEGSGRVVDAAAPPGSPGPQQQPHQVIVLDHDSPAVLPCPAPPPPGCAATPADRLPDTPCVTTLAATPAVVAHTPGEAPGSGRDVSRHTPKHLTHLLPVDHPSAMQLGVAGPGGSPAAGTACTPLTSQARRIVPTPVSGGGVPVQLPSALPAAAPAAAAAAAAAAGSAAPRRIQPVPVTVTTAATAPHVSGVCTTAAVSVSQVVPAAAPTSQAKRRICPTPAGSTTAGSTTATVPSSNLAGLGPAAAPAAPVETAVYVEADAGAAEVTAAIRVGAATGEDSKLPAPRRPTAGKMSVAMLAALAGKKAAKVSQPVEAAGDNVADKAEPESGPLKKQRVEEGA